MSSGVEQRVDVSVPSALLVGTPAQPVGDDGAEGGTDEVVLEEEVEAGRRGALPGRLELAREAVEVRAVEIAPVARDQAHPRDERRRVEVVEVGLDAVDGHPDGPVVGASDPESVDGDRRGRRVVEPLEEPVGNASARQQVPADRSVPLVHERGAGAHGGVHADTGAPWGKSPAGGRGS